MTNPFEKPPMPSPEKPEEEKPKTSDELIKEDKDLRTEFFKLRNKLEGKEISQEEKKKIKERLEEINKKCEPTSKELDSKSEGLYSKIMDIPVRKRKGTSDEKWQDTIKKSGEVLKEAEAKLRKMEDADPNIKKYLEERIKQKREQLGIAEVISPEPTLKEEIIEKPEKLEKLKPEEISFEQKIKEKVEKGEPLSKEDIETWERIKFQKALEEMRTEVRELREKRQRGEVFSEEEKQRLEMVKLKWDILQRSSEIKKEKTKEKLEKELEERRKIYAEARKQSREVLAKGKKEKKLKELLEAYEPTIKPVREKYILVGDSEKLKQGDKDAEERRKNFIGKLTASGIKKEKAEAIYEAELKEAEYDQTKIDYGKKLEKEGVSMNEIYNRVYCKEEELLKNAQVEAWPPKEKNIFRRAMEGWLKMPTKKRILYSTLALTGGLAAAGAIGGIGILAGASTATIAKFGGFQFVRALAGATVGQAVAGVIEKTYGRKLGKTKAEEEKKLIAEFTIDNFSEIKEKRRQHQERWYKKERNKTLVKAVAATIAGGGIAFGLGPMIGGALGIKIMPEALAKPAVPSPEASPQEAPAKPGAAPPTEIKLEGLSPEQLQELKERFPGMKYEIETFEAKAKLEPGRAEAPPEAVPTVENIIEIQKGDSVWRIVERQLELNYGQKFTSLNEAQKTYIIDALKDKIAENPKSFGLEDIDEIKTGQKIDLTSIFEDKAGIENGFKRAVGLSQAQIEQIEHNNEILRNWLKEHPGQRLTSERIEEILGKGKIKPAAEIPTAETPTTEAPAPEIPAAEAPTTEAPAPEILKADPEVARIMDLNEIANIKALGLTEGEYKAIHNLTVGKLLEQIPEDKDEAWRIFGGQVPDKEIDLPHYGIYGAIEFKKHLKLVDFIRSFKPGEEIKEMTVRQFLRTVGPKGTIIM